MRGRQLRALSLAIAAAIAGVVPSAVSCTVPSLDLNGKKCRSASDCAPGDTCTSEGVCAVPPGAADASPTDSAPSDANGPVNPCMVLPHFSGQQTVDGLDDDFASVPVESYPWNSLPASNNYVPPSGIVGLDITMQVGWSAEGLHFFFHVHYEQDGVVVLPASGDPLWYGDALELFLKGDSRLAGAFDSFHDVGALHLAASPDQPNPPRTQAYVSAGDVTTNPLPSGDVAAHLDSDGYDLEFLVPWTAVLAPQEPSPEAGATIALDFGVDYRDRDPDADPSMQPAYQLLLQQGGAISPTTCPGGQALPPCDDRTWCTPTLAR